MSSEDACQDIQLRIPLLYEDNSLVWNTPANCTPNEACVNIPVREIDVASACLVSHRKFCLVGSRVEYIMCLHVRTISSSCLFPPISCQPCDVFSDAFVDSRRDLQNCSLRMPSITDRFVLPSRRCRRCFWRRPPNRQDIIEV